MAYQCANCNEEFCDSDECVGHMRYRGHWVECETCTASFRTIHARNQHMNAKQHWGQRYGCQTCTLQFYKEDDARKHMSDNGHYKHLYCKDCDRYFQNENNLKQHRNSRVHRGQTITCPFCKDNYVTASGLAHHLETGSSVKASQLNRDTVHGIIRERDPNGLITNKTLTYTAPTTTPTWTIGSSNWKGLWDCPLCSQEFRSANSLKQHLESPKHQQKMYHCPNGRRGKEFTTLAAILNHLESESCAYMKFEKVQNTVSTVFSSNRMITLG